MEKELYVYGERLSEDDINLLTEEIGIENMTTEYLETVFYYDYMDNK